MKTLQEHLAADGKPKRILSLDGGGIRGIITLAYLERIEQILRDRHNNQKLVLSDYFDLIGGTSTGAIIATALALGHEVAFIREKYEGLGKKIFKNWGWLDRWLLFLFKGHFFNKTQLIEQLSDIFKDETLGSEQLKTGLGIVARRTDTGSTWFMFNKDEGHEFYNDNKNILLTDLLRASAAAPTYFKAENLKVTNDILKPENGWFVDGGVSMHNNPALLLMFAATLKGYGIKWAGGSEKLMIVSVGTGWWKHKFEKNGISVLKMKNIPSMLMDDSSALTETMLQIMSKNSPTARKIDSLLSNLKDETLLTESACHYLRYNLQIEEDVLKDKKYEIEKVNIDSLREMSNAKNIALLLKIGRKAAVIELPDDKIAEHFPAVFDLK